MKLRVGVFDIAAAVIVVIAIVLPPRTPGVHAPFPPIAPETAGEISRLQARLIADPTDGAAAEELAELLSAAGYSDWALRVAGAAARHHDSPTVWRALRGLSTTHADRVEIADAYRWAERALEACRQEGARCAEHEDVRLSIYVEQLEVGLHSGIDPKVDPAAFRTAISRAGIRQVRLPGPREKDEPVAPPAPTPETAAPAVPAPTPQPGETPSDSPK
jgi:hypothetical protein